MKYAYIPWAIARKWKSIQFDEAEALIKEKGSLSRIGNVHALGLLFKWPSLFLLPVWAKWFPE